MKSDRPTRTAYFVWELPEEWIEALRNADYSHLPRLAGKPDKTQNK